MLTHWQACSRNAHVALVRWLIKSDKYDEEFCLQNISIIKMISRGNPGALLPGCLPLGRSNSSSSGALPIITCHSGTLNSVNCQNCRIVKVTISCPANHHLIFRLWHPPNLSCLTMAFVWLPRFSLLWQKSECNCGQDVPPHIDTLIDPLLITSGHRAPPLRTLPSLSELQPPPPTQPPLLVLLLFLLLLLLLERCYYYYYYYY